MPDVGKLVGKVCLITGATSGIGAATALSFAREGATVIGTGRNPGKCRRSAEHIIRATGNPRVEFLLADLSVQCEVHALATRFRSRYSRLDVLVNNAGARFSSRLVSADNYEMTFALNHMGYFLLTGLLLHELKKSGQGRIINVASGAHRGCTGINFEDLQSERGYDGKAAYAQSKLANLLFTYELDRLLKRAGLPITVNAVDPGNVLTRFSRNNGLISWARHIIGSLRSGSLVGPTEGAKTIVYLALSPQIGGASGGYFASCKLAQSSEASLDTEAARRLWQINTELDRIGAVYLW
jgi:retinol dehydrogenase-12